MSVLKRHRYFILFYGALFISFLWPLLALKSSFLLGDYWVQFYPWSHHLATVLKNGQLPYWTNLMACGFPLVAEGQVGAYYPIHLILYRILPFFAAYTWNIPLHMGIGGLGFYWYARRIGLKNEGSVLSAVIFSFSSAYGGCFYTTGTLRVLSWLPWGLWLLEGLRSADKKEAKVFLVLSLGVLASFMWTAGFPQLAFYAIGYLALSILLDHRKRMEMIFYLAVASVTGILLALPQIFQTLQLAGVSVRSGETVQFAMWGSVPPPAVLSLLFPHWGNLLQVSFYMGTLPIFFIGWVLLLKKTPCETKHLWLALIFFFLALGKYNPLYSLVVENLSLTGFRNPAKFLFFSVSSLGIVAGSGYERYLNGEGDRRRFWKGAVWLAVGAILMPLVAAFLLNLTKDPLMEYGRHYAESVYAAKIDPTHDKSYYYRFISLFVERLGQALKYSNPWNLRTVSFVLIFLLLSRFYFKGLISKNGVKWLVALILIVDLFWFGRWMGTGFIGNAASKEMLAEPPRILEPLKQRLHVKEAKIVEFTASQETEMFPPNSNMLYDLPHAGGYSPLLIKRYHELVKDFGFSDASLGRRPYSLENWARQRKLLDLLGVGVVLSEGPLDLPGLELAGNFQGRTIYRNPSALSKLHLVPQWKIIEDKKNRLEYLKSGSFEPSSEAVLETDPNMDSSKDGWQVPSEIIFTKENAFELEASVRTGQDSVAVFQSVYYPAWKVLVDGKKETLIPVNHALTGVFLKKGEHSLRFYYDHSSFKMIERFSWVAWITVVVCLVVFRKGKSIEA